MPLAFPSHQGLVLPLTRWVRLDIVALSVGAALPDIVETLFWPLRGELGQWIGHSLLGVVIFVPIGLVLTWLTRRFTPKGWLARLDRNGNCGPRNAAASVALGAFSHVVTDFFTHANFVLFVPFYEKKDGGGVFPSWWTHEWTSVRVPLFYREPYPIAPHTIVWALASILGAVLFWRFVRRGRSATDDLHAVRVPTDVA